MADTPRLLVEISGEAGGFFSVLAKVQERLEMMQKLGGTSADVAKKSMNALEVGAQAAARALEDATKELTELQRKEKASAGMGGYGTQIQAAEAKIKAAQQALDGFNAKIAQAQSRIQNAATSNQHFGSTLKTATDQGAQGMKKVGDHAESTTNSIIKAGVALQVVRSVFNGLREVAEGALQQNLALERSARTLEMATGNGAAGMAFARKTAHELGLDLVTTAEGYAKMAASAKGTALEGRQTELVFTAVSRAAAAMGLNAEKTDGVLLALSQMISKGKVSAEEMRRQLGEHLPGAFSIAARAMGVTTGELDKMMSTGKLATVDFLPKFAVELNKTLGDAPEKAADSLQANINRIKTALQTLSFEAGQGGASSALSASLKELGDTLNSREGIASAQELGATLGNTLAVMKDVAVVAWKLRDPILALAAAYGAMLALQIGKSVVSWGVSKAALVTQTLAARDATVQEAIALAGHNYQANQNTLAQIANAQATVARNSAVLAGAVADGVITEADAVATRQALAHAAARLEEAAALATAGAAGRAYAGFAAVLGGPMGIALAAVAALTAGWVLLGGQIKSAEEKHREALREIQSTGESSRAVKSLGEEYGELAKAMESGKLKGKELESAQNRIKAIQNQLILQAPELKKVLENEKASWDDIKKAIDGATSAMDGNLQVKREMAEIQANDAEAQVASLARQMADSKRLRESGQLSGFGMSAALTAERDMKTLLDKAQEQAKQARQAMASIDAILSPAAPGGGKSSTTPKAGKDTTYQELQNRLEKERIDLLKGQTLEMEKQAAIEKANLKLKEDEQAIDKALKAGDIDRTKAGALRELAQKNHTAALLKIDQEYKEKREKLQEDLQTSLTGQEEGGMAKRLKVIEANFQKILELNNKLKEDGKATYTAEEIAFAKSQAIWRAWLEQVKQDLTALKQELTNLAQEKGRALTPEEKESVLGRYESAGGSKASAAGQYRTQDHQGGTGFQGAQTALDNYLNQSKNDFKNWEGYVTSMLNGTEGAFASFFQSLFQHGSTFSQKMKALWKGLSSTIISELSKWAAKELMLWGIQKAIHLWKIISGQTEMAQSQQKVVTNTAETTSNLGVTGSNIGKASSGFFSAYASIPWVGFALAAACIIGMLAMLGPLTGRKVGGLVGQNGPEATMLGEEGLEVVAPDRDFKDYVAGVSGMGARMAMNIAHQELRTQDYQRQAAGYASYARENAGTGAGPGYVDLRGAVIAGESAESGRIISKLIHKHSTTYDKRNG